LTRLPSDRPSTFDRLLLVALPATLSGLVFLVFSTAKGPLWLGTNSDPDYCYLLNALNLAQGLPPGHTDHPGTFLQALCALILRAAHFLAGRSTLVDDILARPEMYLAILTIAILFLYAASLTWLGLNTRRFTGSTAAAALAQAGPFLSPVVAESLVRLRPEPLLLALSACLAALAAGSLCKAPRRSSGALATLMGATVGAAMATKITAAPLLLFPLFVLAKWRTRGVFLLVSVLSAVLFVAPAWGHLDGFRFIVGRIATHQGRYGQGAPGLFDLHNYANALVDLLVSSPLLTVTLALVPIALALDRRTGIQQGSRSSVLGLGVTQVASVLLVARHPGLDYLAPALGLMGFTLALCGIVAWRAIDRRDLRWGMTLAFTVTVCALGMADTAHLLRQTRAATHAQLEVVARAHQSGIPFIMYYYRASSLAFALHFGNTYSGWAYSSRLGVLFPNALYFDRWNQTLHAYRKPFIDRSGDGRLVVLMQGTPFTSQQLSALPFRTSLLFSNNVEALYEVR
jgi:hypothetical protein